MPPNRAPGPLCSGFTCRVGRGSQMDKSRDRQRCLEGKGRVVKDKTDAGGAGLGGEGSGGRRRARL